MLTASRSLRPAWLVLAASASTAQEPAPAEAAAALSMPAVDAGSLDAWSEHIRPSRDELVWETIGWRSTFADGVRAADAERKPLLFWAMNGHPLGCT